VDFRKASIIDIIDFLNDPEVYPHVKSEITTAPVDVVLRLPTGTRIEDVPSVTLFMKGMDVTLHQVLLRVSRKTHLDLDMTAEPIVFGTRNVNKKSESQ